MPVRIAIIGKPNVGKSTLFNYFTRKKLALVANIPGLTRDRQIAKGQLFDLEFDIVDTAGFEHKHSLAQQIKEQINVAVNEADILLFVIDARSGVTAHDNEFARIIRQQAKNIICVVNKSEGKALESLPRGDVYKLGFKNIAYVSAEHNLGFVELYQEIKKISDNIAVKNDDADAVKPIKIAIVGKPNVGKSTFINSILGEERLLVADVAGVTRDAVKVRRNIDGKEIEFVDTAGIRKKSQINDQIEEWSVQESFRNIRLAEIVVYLIDATSLKFIKQDLSLIRHALDEGRVVIIVLNKWDLIEKSGDLSFTELQKSINLELDVISNYPLKKISALNQNDTYDILKKALVEYEKWNKHIPTSKLNRVFKDITTQHQPKLYKGKAVKFKYISQGKTRPPTFYINCNLANAVSDDYIRYIRKQLAEHFDLQHIPIRIKLTKSENPYG